ncbi:unnamed protein product, partial [Phaeothamnion confervicola]
PDQGHIVQGRPLRASTLCRSAESRQRTPESARQVDLPQTQDLLLAGCIFWDQIGISCRHAIAAKHAEQGGTIRDALEWFTSAFARQYQPDRELPEGLLRQPWHRASSRRECYLRRGNSSAAGASPARWPPQHSPIRQCRGGFWWARQQPRSNVYAASATVTGTIHAFARHRRRPLKARLTVGHCRMVASNGAQAAENLATVFRLAAG